MTEYKPDLVPLVTLMVVVMVLVGVSIWRTTRRLDQNQTTREGYCSSQSGTITEERACVHNNTQVYIKWPDWIPQ